MGIEKDQWYEMNALFHDEGLYHIETSSLICRANQWTCFYMIGTYVMEELYCCSLDRDNMLQRNLQFTFPVDTGRKLNVHKTFRRLLGRLLNILCTFNLRPVSTG